MKKITLKVLLPTSAEVFFILLLLSYISAAMMIKDSALLALGIPVIWVVLMLSFCLFDLIVERKINLFIIRLLFILICLIPLIMLIYIRIKM